MSQSNTSEEGRITLNLGVYYPAIARLSGTPPTTSLPKEYDCTLRRRIGTLMERGEDYWWRVDDFRMTPKSRLMLRDASKSSGCHGSNRCHQSAPRKSNLSEKNAPSSQPSLHSMRVVKKKRGPGLTLP